MKYVFLGSECLDNYLQRQKTFGIGVTNITYQPLGTPLASWSLNYVQLVSGMGLPMREAITKESIKRNKEQDQSSRNAERMTESLTKNRSESHDSHRHR